MKYLPKQLAGLGVVILGLIAIGSVSAYQCDCEQAFQNCAVPITTLNGQGFSVSGVSGGLSLGDPRTFRQAEEVTDPALLFHNAGTHNDAVAILVIDDFGQTGSYKIPETVYALHDQTQLEDAYRDGTLSHGALVFNHFNALLKGALDDAGFDPYPNEESVEWSDGSARIGVFVVDALDYAAPVPTNDVATTTANVIRDLRGNGYSHFVLNMSFAVLPCSIANGYADYAGPQLSFEAYAAQVSAATGLSYAQLITPAESLLYPDPLHVLLVQCDDSNKTPHTFRQSAMQAEPIPVEPPDGVRRVWGVIDSPCETEQQRVDYVGSAGNSGLPYPFFPAAWNPVTSVSADDADGNLSFYSNYNADSSRPGGWFVLTDEDGNTIFYRGTSFSGPVQAVCMALDIYC